jgi:ribonucleotide monophosphatase NagD (HAD superfamily)
MGDARDELCYASLNKAFQLCKQGAPLIGMGMNKYFKDEQYSLLDSGAFIHPIEWAADTQAIIMGKPSGAFFAEVVSSTPYPAAQCLMVGDDAENDVQGAIDAGLQGCLVKTGKYQPGDEKCLPAGTAVMASIADLFSA